MRVESVLVSMPFMDAHRPSIQLGLLAATARTHGLNVRTLHANLDLAARIGPERYDALADGRGTMLGDWLFSVAAFGERAPDPEGRLLDGLPERDLLLRIRDHDVPAYLDELLDLPLWASASAVGFSCTFQQNTASFALAARLKRRFPQLVTIFGGANFDGEMGLELLRTVECVDYAVIGEGDVTFPRLLQTLSGTDGGAAGVSGVV
ncbi:RiPP maturation radical SAM protein 1, partial [Nonomuraea sp. NN258]|nr:RiPP maturation radical SAM protein 1 [Nonomuraea antri]